MSRSNINYMYGVINHVLTCYFVLAVLNVLVCNRCARCAEWGAGVNQWGKEAKKNLSCRPVSRTAKPNINTLYLP